MCRSSVLVIYSILFNLNKKKNPKNTPACKTAILPDVVKYNVQPCTTKLQNSRAPTQWVEKQWQAQTKTFTF
jgi:hypothetical protein